MPTTGARSPNSNPTHVPTPFPSVKTPTTGTTVPGGKVPTVEPTVVDTSFRWGGSVAPSPEPTFGPYIVGLMMTQQLACGQVGGREVGGQEPATLKQLIDRSQGLFLNYFKLALVAAGVLPQLASANLAADPFRGYLINFPAKGDKFGMGEIYPVDNPAPGPSRVDYSNISWPAGGHRPPYLRPTYELNFTIDFNGLLLADTMELHGHANPEFDTLDAYDEMVETLPPAITGGVFQAALLHQVRGVCGLLFLLLCLCTPLSSSLLSSPHFSSP